MLYSSILSTGRYDAWTNSLCLDIILLTILDWCFAFHLMVREHGCVPWLLYLFYSRCLAGHKQCPSSLMIWWSMCKLFWRGLMKDAELHTWRYFSLFWIKKLLIEWKETARLWWIYNPLKEYKQKTKNTSINSSIIRNMTRAHGARQSQLFETTTSWSS